MQQLCLQEPGDAVFVPQDWAHGVKNLEFSAAIAEGVDVIGRSFASEVEVAQRAWQ